MDLLDISTHLSSGRLLDVFLLLAIVVMVAWPVGWLLGHVPRR